MKRCHICGKPLTGKSFSLKEQYFGSGDEFSYTQCQNCMCIQILEIPADLGKYYPPEYYSKQIKKQYRHNALLSLLRSLRLDATLHDSPLRHILTSPNLPRWVAFTDLNSNSRILDVGCGSGQRLLNLRKKGLHHLEGVEPFIENDIHYANGVVIHNCELSSLANKSDKQGYFDLIMMHHSLEHIPDQHLIMESVQQLLSGHGKLLIRIPVCSSYAWEHYGHNWVQLDAPRHLYTHSRKSIELLAARHGFQCRHTYFDSYELQFTGSERYLRGISLIDGKDDNHFTADQIQRYREMAEILNREERGDQAAFIFTRKQDNRTVSR